MERDYINIQGLNYSELPGAPDIYQEFVPTMPIITQLIRRHKISRMGTATSISRHGAARAGPGALQLEGARRATHLRRDPAGDHGNTYGASSPLPSLLHAD